MLRSRSTNRSGGPFSETKKKRVWEKAQILVGYNPDRFRKDICNAWIDYDKYGDTTPNGKGWEIDHIIPVSKTGSDDLNNLQPLQWQNNRAKGDDYPGGNFCVVVSE